MPPLKAQEFNVPEEKPAETSDKTAADQARDTERDMVALEQSARHIIASENVLGLFDQSWSQIVAGESKNARFLYLAATSRLFDRTMHVAIKGPSAAGKSEIRKRMLDFIPPESIIEFTALSERALIYEEREFSHKILSMGEAAGTDEQSLQDYLLRELMSAGKLIYQTVQKVGSDLETITIEKDGPVVFMVTTTRHKLHPENETRMVSLEVDDSETQTRLVMGKAAQVYGLNAVPEANDLEPWHDFQRWLDGGDKVVVVPFAPVLAGLIPAKAVRLRRDFMQLLQAIKAHALLHRAHRARDDRGQIVADIEHDYTIVRELMADIIAETADAKLSDTRQQTVNAVADLTSRMLDDEGCTAVAVAKALALDKSAARRRLVAAVMDGHIINLETRRGQPGKYRVATDEVEVVQMLPTPTELAETFSYYPPLKSVPPCHRDIESQESQRLDGGKDDCHRDCHRETDGTGGNAGGAGVATTETQAAQTIAVAGGTVAADSEGIDGGLTDEEVDRLERAAIQAESSFGDCVK